MVDRKYLRQFLWLTVNFYIFEEKLKYDNSQVYRKPMS